MEDTCASDSIRHLRATNKDNLTALRTQNRESILSRRRLTLHEVEAIVSGVTLDQFKEFTLRVKEKKATVDVLKAIKNNCCTSSTSEAFIKLDGALCALVRILVGSNAEMQLEAAACLTNLACGSHKASLRIAKAAGPYLVSFLGSGSHYLQDQSAWAAGNIANDCLQCFSLLKSQGIVPALLANIQSPVPDVTRSTVFALNACTKYEDNNLRELTEPHIMNLLLSLLNQENLGQNTISDVAFILSNIFFLAATNSIEISDSFIEPILTCLYNSVSTKELNYSVAVPLVRCLGFLSHRESASQYLSLQPTFKESVAQIFSSRSRILILEVLWVLTNILGYVDATTLDIDLNLVVEAIDIKVLTDPSTMHVLYFLCTWASKNYTVRTQLQEQGYISKMESLLTCGVKTVENGAKVFFNIVQ